LSKLRLHITMSLDGCVAGPDQGEENPLGVGGEELHNWFVPLQAFQEAHGRSGGEVNASTPVAEERMENLGAAIMGRNMFGGGPGPWPEEPWNGYWGDNPPYHYPVFVLTHHEREPQEMEGDTTFYFVTGGIESALDQAKEAAGGKDVWLAGGADAANQYLAAGLVDEIDLSIAPLLLGDGARLFDGVGSDAVALEQVRAVDAPGATHIKYAVRAT
jgi:dihydrofolate reductase